MKRRNGALALIGWSLITLQPVAAEEDYVDFSDRTTPMCELIGLVGLPPTGWFNVPIETEREDIVGCQMMRTNDRDELVGILRLISRVFAAESPEETWLPELLGGEVAWLEEMGITLGETLWRRDDVPMTGTDWEQAKAFGLAASAEDNDTPQEVHFLTFGGATTKYLIDLVTPAQAVDEGLYYGRNTEDFGVLIRTLQFPDSE